MGCSGSRIVYRIGQVMVGCSGPRIGQVLVGCSGPRIVEGYIK